MDPTKLKETRGSVWNSYDRQILRIKILFFACCLVLAIILFFWWKSENMRTSTAPSSLDAPSTNGIDVTTDSILYEEFLMDSVNREIEKRILESLPEHQELDYGQMRLDDAEYEVVDDSAGVL